MTDRPGTEEARESAAAIARVFFDRVSRQGMPGWLRGSSANALRPKDSGDAVE